MAFAGIEEKLVESIENGMPASCEKILAYPPSANSSSKKSVFNCQRVDSWDGLAHIILKVKVSKDGILEESIIQECSKIKVIDTIWRKSVRCIRK